MFASPAEFGLAPSIALPRAAQSDTEGFASHTALVLSSATPSRHRRPLVLAPHTLPPPGKFAGNRRVGYVVANVLAGPNYSLLPVSRYATPTTYVTRPPTLRLRRASPKRDLVHTFVVRYVVNRNIQLHEHCTSRARSCAFRKAARTTYFGGRFTQLI